jgi:hypothetical protein
MFYPSVLSWLADRQTLLLAALGAAAGLIAKTRRRHTAALLAWIAVSYVVFSYIDIKEDRYILPLVAPLLFLCVTSLAVGSGWLSRHVRLPAGTVLATAISTLIFLQIVEAYTTRVPDVRGFREAASYLAGTAPDEMVLYEGYHDGVFMFYMLAGDPGFRRGVVLGRKVLADVADEWRPGGPAPAGELREAIRDRSGTRWLVLEDVDGGDDRLVPRLLEAVRSPDIELVHSFPITTPAPGWLRVYRWRKPIEPRQYLDLSFPDLGSGVHYELSPIEPRASGSASPDGTRP